MNEIIEYLKDQNVIISDISTDDGDLEDVFIRLTKKLDYFKYKIVIYEYGTCKKISNNKIIKSFFNYFLEQFY